MIEKILNILGQSGHFYRIVSEGYCVPEEGRKMIIQIQGIPSESIQSDIKSLGFEVQSVSINLTMYFIEK